MHITFRCKYNTNRDYKPMQDLMSSVTTLQLQNGDSLASVSQKGAQYESVPTFD